MGTVTLNVVIILGIMIVGGFLLYFLASLFYPTRDKEEEKVKFIKIVEKKTDKQKIEEGIIALERRKEEIVKRLIEQKQPEEVKDEIEEVVEEKEAELVLAPIEFKNEEVEYIAPVEPTEEVAKNPRRKRSFTVKISSSTDAVKKYFSAIINKFRSYGVNVKVGKTKAMFKIKKDVYGKFIFKAKKLVLCLPLNPKSEKYQEEIYKQIDYSGKRGFEELAFGMKIATKKASKLALELIEDVAKKFDLQLKEKFKEIDYVEKYPDIYSNFEKLGYGWMVKGEVVREEAEIWPDTFAEKIILEQPLYEKQPKRLNKEDIRIEEFNNRYTDTSEPVDIVRLKESGLVGANANYIVVKASARIDKAFNVYAHEFEPDAVKMICMAGGQAYKLEYEKDE